MDDATQAQIFEPFFSTKGSSGTGLGLSTVLGILDKSAATIAVQSALGEGTTFSIRFPRHHEAPALLEKQKTAALIGGRETILLVEDSEALRELTCHLLRGCGYTVLDAGNPAEAILIAEQHKGPLPLLITDIVLPGINGRELAERLTSARHEMRVLYTSGFIEIPEAMHANSILKCAFLEKPFTRLELITTVRGLLDAAEHLAA
jgi:two-component system, cell cycle sensor histidine kinase and response regulator CckA